MLATDPYGKFIPGPLRGLPQYVTKLGPDGTPNTGDELVEGDIANPVPPPADVRHFDTPFLTDIAHNADPGTVGLQPATSGTPSGCLDADADNVASADFAHQPPGTYDDEMLNATSPPVTAGEREHRAETIHQIFHSEHDRLAADITSSPPARIASAAA